MPFLVLYACLKSVYFDSRCTKSIHDYVYRDIRGILLGRGMGLKIADIKKKWLKYFDKQKKKKKDP